MLLNVGPKPDGTIPQEAADILLGVCKWLDVTGEAIYGTRHWETSGEGPTNVSTVRLIEREYAPFTAQDIRFTVKGDTIYAICLGWPEGECTIASLGSGRPVAAGESTEITMLGIDEPLNWRHETTGLTDQMPGQKTGEHACTFKIVLNR